MDTISILDDLDARRRIAATVEEPAYSHLSVRQTVAYRTQVAQLWMEEDFRRDVLPVSTNSFSAVHEYMDANEYLMDEYHPVERLRSILDWDLPFFDFYDQYQLMVDALDKWLSSGRHGQAADYLHDSK